MTGPLTIESTAALSDVQQIFQVDHNQSMQLAVLSQKEMKETMVHGVQAVQLSAG